jgi:hypothetical protein
MDEDYGSANRVPRTDILFFSCTELREVDVAHVREESFSTGSD